MTVTNNGLICQHYYKEEEYLNECLHAYMYITDSVGLVTVPWVQTAPYIQTSNIFSPLVFSTSSSSPKCVRMRRLTFVVVVVKVDIGRLALFPCVFLINIMR